MVTFDGVMQKRTSAPRPSIRSPGWPCHVLRAKQQPWQKSIHRPWIDLTRFRGSFVGRFLANETIQIKAPITSHRSPWECIRAVARRAELVHLNRRRDRQLPTGPALLSAGRLFADSPRHSAGPGPHPLCPSTPGGGPCQFSVLALPCDDFLIVFNSSPVFATLTCLGLGAGRMMLRWRGMSEPSELRPGAANCHTSGQFGKPSSCGWSGRSQRDRAAEGAGCYLSSALCGRERHDRGSAVLRRGRDLEPAFTISALPKTVLPARNTPRTGRRKGPFAWDCNDSIARLTSGQCARHIVGLIQIILDAAVST